jgi:hypothetical protein
MIFIAMISMAMENPTFSSMIFPLKPPFFVRGFPVLAAFPIAGKAKSLFKPRKWKLMGIKWNIY